MQDDLREKMKAFEEDLGPGNANITNFYTLKEDSFQI